MFLCVAPTLLVKVIKHVDPKPQTRIVRCAPEGGVVEPTGNIRIGSIDGENRMAVGQFEAVELDRGVHGRIREDNVHIAIEILSDATHQNRRIRRG